MIAANETESKWWICDCCCRFITLRCHASNILYLWKSAQWQMIKVHKKCRIDDILIKENPFFFDRTTSNVPVDGSCTKWSRSYDSQFRVLHRHHRSWWYESLRWHYNICKGVYTVFNLIEPPTSNNTTPPPPTSIGNSQLACISKFTVRHIFMFCYYLLFCCKINLVLAENDANLINNTLNEHSVPRLKIW